MLTALVSLVLAVTALPAKPLHYVTDNANVLPAAQRDALELELKNFERATTNQIVVYIDRRLPANTTLEEISNDAIHQWQIGQKGKDNGAILFVFVDDRKMRIEVGYGLEPLLTDAKSKEILHYKMRPLLQQGDPAAAIEAGVTGMLDATRRDTPLSTPQAAKGADAAVVTGDDPVFVLAAVFGVFALIIGIFIAVKLSGFKNKTWSRGKSTTRGRDGVVTTTSSRNTESASDVFSSGGGDGGGGGASDSW
jgi:uncharacterized protein